MAEIEECIDVIIPADIILKCFEFYPKIGNHFILDGHTLSSYQTKTNFEIGQCIGYNNDEYYVHRLSGQNTKIMIRNTINTSDYQWIPIPNKNIYPIQLFDTINMSSDDLGIICESSTEEQKNLLLSSLNNFIPNLNHLDLQNSTMSPRLSYKSYTERLFVAKNGWNSRLCIKKILRLQLVSDNENAECNNCNYHRIGLCTNNHNKELGNVFYWDRFDKKIKINNQYQFDTYQEWKKFDIISIVIDMTNENTHKLEFFLNDYPVCNVINIIIPNNKEVTYYPMYEIYDNMKTIKYKMIHRKSQQTIQIKMNQKTFER